VNKNVFALVHDDQKYKRRTSHSNPPENVLNDGLFDRFNTESANALFIRFFLIYYYHLPTWLALRTPEMTWQRSVTTQLRSPLKEF
jgi:hypothetical protein